MAGAEFYQDDDIQRVLSQETMPRENRLELLLFNSGVEIDNEALRDLCDVIECKETYADGSSTVYRERSGKIIKAAA